MTFIKTLTISLTLMFLICTETVIAQIVQIQDVEFKNKLLEANSSNTIAKNLNNAFFKIDSNSDGEIQESEATEVTYLNLDFVSNPGTLTSLDGIESFTNLETLITYELAIEDFNYTLNNLLTLNLSYHLIEQLHLENLCALQSFESTQSPSNLATKSLKEIYLKNNKDITSFSVYNGTGLNWICADVSELTLILNGLFRNSGIQIDSNCTTFDCSVLSNVKHKIKFGLSIYPNPVMDYLNMKSSSDILSYKIFDLNGRIILNEKMNTQNENIKVSRLPSGIYFINVKTIDYEIYEKFIKK